jgi:hypothetical protein
MFMALRGFLSHLDLNVAEPRRSIVFYALVLGELGYEQTSLGDDRAVWSLTMPKHSTIPMAYALRSCTSRYPTPDRARQATSRRPVIPSALVVWTYQDGRFRQR